MKKTFLLASLLLLFSPLLRAQDCTDVPDTGAPLNLALPIKHCTNWDVQMNENFVKLNQAFTGGGTGTVTLVSSGDLQPLFTTAVDTATTTPSLQFTAVPQPSFTFYGNFSGSTLAPSFWTLAAGTNISFTAIGSVLTINASGGGGGGCTPISDGGHCVTDNPTLGQNIVQSGTSQFSVTTASSGQIALITGTGGGLNFISAGGTSYSNSDPSVGMSITNGGGGPMVIQENGGLMSINAQAGLGISVVGTFNEIGSAAINVIAGAHLNLFGTLTNVNSSLAIIDPTSSGVATFLSTALLGGDNFSYNLPRANGTLLLTPAAGVAWSAGAGAPGGACTNGAIYTSTTGTTTNILWVCGSSTWHQVL